MSSFFHHTFLFLIITLSKPFITLFPINSFPPNISLYPLLISLSYHPSIQSPHIIYYSKAILIPTITTTHYFHYHLHYYSFIQLNY